MFEKTKAICDSFLEMGVPGFDVIVYHKGQCILRHMGGYSDLEKKIPMNGKERYNIYSCSKPITCTAAMQLWEKGAFRLEDKLSDYMPEFANMTVQTEDGIREAKEPIRIQNLFGMSAGFSYNVHSPRLTALREDTDGRSPTREAMRYLAQEPLCFDPGARYQYSLCHDVLVALVEVLSGKLFEDYVQENIFKPLGMEHSTFLLPQEQRESLAGQYRFDSEAGKAVNWGKDNRYLLGTEYASGGAGCVSTVEDYIRFAEALRVGERLLKRETIQLMTTDRLTDGQRATFTLPDYGYGLGMRCPKAGGSRVDFGWGGAAGAYLAVDIPHEISLYYAQHMLASPNQKLRSKVYLAVLEDLFGEAATETASGDNRLTY